MVLRLFTFIATCCLFFSLHAQSDMDGVIVTALTVTTQEQAKQCHTKRFDQRSVRLKFGFEDTLNLLADFAYEEENFDAADCFIPDLKLTFRYYTYVISMECYKVVKYQNSADFVTSSKRMPNDLVFTPSVYDYFDGLLGKHFPGHRADPNLVERSLGTDYMKANDDLDDLENMLYDDDDDDGDQDLLDLDDSDDSMFDEIEPIEDEDDDGDGK
ncbi:MAG: hypothetical protein AB8F95_16585 [Bacteroidia bacterium]